MSHSSRLAYLLGEMRRMMNGAVVGSMRFYGADYGLNYGVSIPTIRSVAQTIKAEVDDREINHRFARQLLLQEVRELRLAAFWFADPQQSLEGWDKAIINSEVAEEAAFALLYSVSAVEEWLSCDCDELLQYCSLLSLAKRGVDVDDIEVLWPKVIQLIKTEPKLLPKGVVALIDTYIKGGIPSDQIKELLNQLPSDNHATNYIRDEVIWRLEFRE